MARYPLLKLLILLTEQMMDSTVLVRDEHARAVVVASVQTLQRDARLQRLVQPFDLVIVDECHHALQNNSYGRILTHVGAFAEDGVCPEYM